MPVILGELERAADDIGETELMRAKAQLRAGLLMTLENRRRGPDSSRGRSCCSAGTFGGGAGGAHRRDHGSRNSQAGRGIITGSRPTLAAVGPLDGLMSAEKVAERFGAHLSA